MRHSVVTRAPLALCLAVMVLLSASCIALPPNYRADQFAPGTGPNLARAATFQGLGAWWDVFDWSPTFLKGKQNVGLADVDRLADAGVQVFYIQTATYRHPDDILDEGLLRQIIARAHARGMRIVGWYLPEHVDVDMDMRRMNKAIALGFDGFGVDIESQRNANVANRSAVLVDEVAQLRAQHPDLPLAAIPVAPIVWEQLNHTWWPNFPYRQLANYFDAWLPQNYFTNRRADSGLRSAYWYNVFNVGLLRQLTGVPWLPVAPIGGISDGVSNADVAEMFRAMHDTNCIGGSLYDAPHTSPSLYGRLRWFRIPK